MGAIWFRGIEFVTALSETLGYKTGLALSEERLRILVEQVDRELWPPSDTATMRIRSEVFEDLFPAGWPSTDQDPLEPGGGPSVGEGIGAAAQSRATPPPPPGPSRTPQAPGPGGTGGGRGRPPGRIKLPPEKRSLLIAAVEAGGTDHACDLNRGSSGRGVITGGSTR